MPSSSDKPECTTEPPEDWEREYAEKALCDLLQAEGQEHSWYAKVAATACLLLAIDLAFRGGWWWIGCALSLWSALMCFLESVTAEEMSEVDPMIGIRERIYPW